MYKEQEKRYEAEANIHVDERHEGQQESRTTIRDVAKKVRANMAK